MKSVYYETKSNNLISGMFQKYSRNTLKLFITGNGNMRGFQSIAIYCSNKCTRISGGMREYT